MIMATSPMTTRKRNKDDINDNKKIEATKTTTNYEDASRAAARGTVFALLLRLISFGCTQITIRTLDPSALGKASIQLELLLTSVLFISREGFRLALTQNISPQNWSVAYLTIPVITIVSGTTLLWHILSTAAARGGEEEDDNTLNDYRIAGILYCLASWIEGCGEPFVLYYLRKLDVPKRVSAEGIATVTKTIVTVIGIQCLSSKSYQVTAFGLAQFTYSITYTSYLYYNAHTELDWISVNERIGWPSLLQNLDWDTCYVTLIYTLQGFFKHLLTEADKIVLTTMADSYDQGVYAMGASYGSIAARMLLQPLEENGRLLWSRLAATTDNDGICNNVQLKESYTTLVKLVSYIGLVFCCIAVNYTNLLLNILAGRKWGANSEAANVLSGFCIYTAFLALNGMAEALVYAVGGSSSGTTATNINATKEMTKLTFVHTITGVIFAISAYILVARYGTLGLVAANCVAMSIRSIYSLFFAARYFPSTTSSRKQGDEKQQSMTLLQLLSVIMPHPVILVSFVATWASTFWSLQMLKAKDYHLQLDIHNKDWLLLTGQHLALGISFVIGIVSLIVVLERPFLQSLTAMVGGRRKGQPQQEGRPKQD
jgi:oligosaccharide translocation protein RFT1